jgi:hypothetical protein
MTRSLRENQERLAARMREIVGLHEAGRAVSSVLGLDEVLRKIVDSVARVLDTRLAALWLVDRSIRRAPTTSASRSPRRGCASAPRAASRLARPRRARAGDTHAANAWSWRRRS